MKRFHWLSGLAFALMLFGASVANAAFTLRQSTSQTIKIGPFLSSTDGNTEQNSLTIANTDVKLSKNGGSLASKNSGGCTFDALGYYACTLDTTDTNTAGMLQLTVHATGALVVYHEFQILATAVYDADYASGATGQRSANVLQFGSSNGTFSGGRPEINMAFAQGVNLAPASCVGAVSSLGLVDCGTAQSATGTTLQIRSAATFADNELTGATCFITGATAGTGQSRIVASNVGSTDTLTMQSAWTTTPTGTILYSCYATAPGAAGLTQTDVRTAVGLASANLDTQLSTITTKTNFLPSATAGAAGGVFIAGTNAATTITTGLTANVTGNLSGSVGSVTGAVGSVTGNVGGNVVGSTASVTGAVGSVTGSVGSVTGAVGSVTGNVGGNVVGSTASVTGAVGSVTGNVGGTVNGLTATAQGNVRTALGLASANVDTQFAAIQADTDDLQTRTPAALVSGRMDSSVGAYQSGQGPLQPTVSGRTLGVNATGQAGIDWANIAAPTTTVGLTGTTISSGQTVASVSGAVGSVTGAVGSVTGNVSGNVTGSVGSVTGAVGSVTGNVGGTVNGLTATAQTNVRTAVGLASANLDTQLGLLATTSALSTVGTNVSGVKTVTDQLATALQLNGAGPNYQFTTGALANAPTGGGGGFTGNQITAIATILGVPASGTTPVTPTAGALLDIENAVAGVQSDTDNIQTRLPTSLVSGRVDASVGAMAANTLTAAATAADAVTEIQTGLATSAALSTVGANVNDLQARIPAALVSGKMDSAVSSLGANTITGASIATDAVTKIQNGLSTLTAAEVWSANIDTGLSAGCAMALTNAYAANNLSSASGTGQYKDPTAGANRITFTISSNGNRVTVRTCPSL